MTYGDYPDLSKVSRVLVVKLRHLGDVLLTSPLFTVLQKHLPHAQIDAYIYEEAKPMLEGHPAIREMIGFDRQWKKLSFFQRLLREWRVLSYLRKQKYDLVINLTEGDRGAFVAKWSGAKIAVGFPPKGKWQKKIYTQIVKITPGLKHTVERNLDALRRIGIFPSEEERELFFHVGQEHKASVLQKIPHSSFILIHPTSRWRFKCWPVSKMRSLIQALVERGENIVITTGPDPIEVAMGKEIAEGFPATLLAGKISLKELGALISLAKQMICVDSVPFHMASALKAHVIALFGPTSDVTWGPWRNSNAKVITKPLPCRPCYQDGCGGSKYSDCLQTLSVDAVLKALV